MNLISIQSRMIPFNKPFLTGKETEYIKDAVLSGKISGNGDFTKKCQSFFEERYGFRKTLLTTSCTDALEMCAMLADIKPGDEVIIPSFTFVSTALAFVRQGARIIFADSSKMSPGIDESKLESLITNKTKAIVVVHYAGIACNMESISLLVKKYKLILIEDAAQAIDSFYNQQPLGSFGHLAAFSFHETKNIISGEGGLLAINDEKYINRSEIIWEKGTNRASFFRGEINKYGWVDIGSSFLPSEIIAAFLFAQLENIDSIQNKRKLIWNRYYERLAAFSKPNGSKIIIIPKEGGNNAHMFYIICNSIEERKALIEYLKNKKIMAVFHYQSLHNSEFYSKFHDGRSLENADFYTDHLLRLPLYFELTLGEVDKICDEIESFYN